VNLHGPVRAAESAGPGTAEVTISFDAWTQGHVAPSTHKVEVVRPKVNTKLEPVSPRLVRSLVHPDRKTSFSLLRYSDDGQRLAVAGYPSGVLQIWDPTAGKELARVETPPGYRGTADYVALTADWATAFVPHNGRKVVRTEQGGEQRVTIDYDGEVRVWDVATGKARPPVKLAPGRGASEAVVSPDGTRLITIEARSYDAKGARTVPHVAVYRDLFGAGPPVELAEGFSMATFAPDGKTFALATSDRENGPGRLRLFDALTGKETAVLAEQPKASIFYPAYSPDGGRVAAEVRALGEAGSVVTVWDTASGRELATLSPAERSVVLRPVFSPDGRFVSAITVNGAGHVWDAATGKLRLTHRFGEKGYTPEVVVSPDGRLAAAVGTPGMNASEFGRDPDPADLPQPRVVLYDLATGQPVETLVCPPGFPGRAAFSPDGKALAVGGSGAVHLFDMSDSPGRDR
jgi:WD40 repeat protein